MILAREGAQENTWSTQSWMIVSGAACGALAVALGIYSFVVDDIGQVFAMMTRTASNGNGSEFYQSVARIAVTDAWIEEAIIGIFFGALIGCFFSILPTLTGKNIRIIGAIGAAIPAVAFLKILGLGWGTIGEVVGIITGVVLGAIVGIIEGMISKDGFIFVFIGSILRKIAQMRNYRFCGALIGMVIGGSTMANYWPVGGLIVGAIAGAMLASKIPSEVTSLGIIGGMILGYVSVVGNDLGRVVSGVVIGLVPVLWGWDIEESVFKKILLTVFFVVMGGAIGYVSVDFFMASDVLHGIIKGAIGGLVVMCIGSAVGESIMHVLEFIGTLTHKLLKN